MSDHDTLRWGDRAEDLRALDRYLTRTREDDEPPPDDDEAPEAPADDGPAPRGDDGYLLAPATAILATHCCLCGKPLLNAASVERGLGPTCAERAGAGDAARPPDWARAARCLARVELEGAALPGWGDDALRTSNMLVHRVGAAPEAPAVPHLCEAIDALGYHRLAARLAERLVPVAVTVAAEGEALVVTTSRLDGDLFDAWVEALRAVPGRRWDGERRANLVPAAARPALWRAVTSVLPRGAVVIGGEQLRAGA